MQSLTQLNNYSNTSVDFVDLRPPEIRFNKSSPDNTSSSVYQTKPFTLQVDPGIEILEIISPTIPVTYSIDLSANPTMSVSWPTMPGSCVSTISNNIYTVSGLKTLSDWATIRIPTINGVASNTPFTYTSTINFDGVLTTWTTSIAIISLNELSAATSNATYSSGVESLLVNTPRIVDTVPGFDTSAYVLTIRADDPLVFGSLSTSGTLGGGSVFTGDSLVLSGSLDQINNHLQTLKFTSAADLNQAWIADYSLYNPNSDFTSLSYQYVESNSYQYMSSAAATYYDKNQLSSINNPALIIDTINPSGTYTMIVIPSAGVFSMSSAGTLGGTSSFSESLTITGTKDQVNSHLLSMSFQPALNAINNFKFRYQLTAPDGITSKLPQNVLIANANAVVTYDELLSPTSSLVYYLVNESLSIYGVPFVGDSAPAPFTTSSYTMTITPSRSTAVTSLSSAGIAPSSVFDPTTKSLTFSGSKEYINSHLSSLSITSPDTNNPFSLSYSLLNPSASFYSIETQTLSDTATLLLTTPSETTFDKNTSQLIGSPATVISNEYTTAGTMTVLVFSDTPSFISNLVTAGTGGVATFNATNKQLTITGTLSEVNSHLTSITLTPGFEYVTTSFLKYRITLSNNMIAQNSQRFVIGRQDTSITNLGVVRSFVSNTSDQLVFASSVPQIIEDSLGNNYSVYLSSSIGYFGLSSSSVSANYSFTGTKEQVNTMLSTIKFYPLKDVVGDQIFTYRQVRAGIDQANQPIAYYGSARSTAIPGLWNS